MSTVHDLTHIRTPLRGEPAEYDIAWLVTVAIELHQLRAACRAPGPDLPGLLGQLADALERVQTGVDAGRLPIQRCADLAPVLDLAAVACRAAAPRRRGRRGRRGAVTRWCPGCGHPYTGSDAQTWADIDACHRQGHQ